MSAFQQSNPVFCSLINKKTNIELIDKETFLNIWDSTFYNKKFERYHFLKKNSFQKFKSLYIFEKIEIIHSIFLIVF